MNPRCPIDQNESYFLLTKEAYSLYKCPQCALVFVYPQPQASFLKDDVYSFKSGYQANKEKDLSKIRLDKKTDRILKTINKNLSTNKPGEQEKKLQNNSAKKILDVGCSNGEFLYLAKKQGFETYGVELNKRTADIAQANGLTVFNGLLGDAPYAPSFFDSIYLGDVIEHVTSPSLFIEQCKRVLKPGGVIVISTPNLDCSWSKITFAFYILFKIPWSSVTPPHHLFQFSYNNLTKLMKNEGCKPVDIWYGKPPRLMYELGSLHLLKRWKERRRINDLIFMIFSFSLYTLTYGLTELFSLFIRKNFAMVATYKYD